MQLPYLSSAYCDSIAGLPREYKEMVLRELAREWGYVFALESHLVVTHLEVEQLSLDFGADTRDGLQS